MIERKAAIAIAEEAISTSKADDLELSIRSRSSATTRFANNAITQNIETMQRNVSATAYFGRKKGTASTTAIDGDSMRGCVHRAEAIARISPEDPESLPSLGPQTHKEFPAWLERTARFGPEQRADAAKVMVEIARANKSTLAGTVERHSSSLTLASKNGLRSHFANTAAETSCTADAGSGGTGWAGDGHRDLDRVDFSSIATQACDKALASVNPSEIEAGDWTVLLEPGAVVGLLNYLIWFWNARDTYAGTTFLSDKIGERLLGENIFLESRPSDPDLLAAPFDWDGIPSFEGLWIDAGRIVRFFHDRWTAKERGVEPTGWPQGLVLRGGDESRESLIETTERGILVSRLWYIRSVDPMKLLLTGMTRDGTFLVEEGRVVRALNNLRFNESTLDALSRVDAMTHARPAGSTGGNRMRAPMLRSHRFHFDSATLF